MYYSRISLAFLLCLLAVFVAVSVQSQDAPKSPPSLDEAKTYADVMAYLNQAPPAADSLDPKQKHAALATLLMPAGEKLLAIAKTPQEKMQAYSLKFAALAHSTFGEVEGTEQKIEAFFKEVAATEDVKDEVDSLQYRILMIQTQVKGIEATEKKLESLIEAIASKKPDGDQAHFLTHVRFFLFSEKAKKAAATPENFAQFKTALKTWIDQDADLIGDVASLGFDVAYRNKTAAEVFAKELTDYIQSAQCKLPAENKKEAIDVLAITLKLAPGVDPKLYGKTLDGKDFDWQSLRGKYVLIKFTATWCGPCKMQIPDMLEAYKKYHDKGLEIISVYVWERQPTPEAAAASIKKFVAEEKLPWLILAEPLALQSQQPEYGATYGIEGVPTFVLVDKEGKTLPMDNGDWKKAVDALFK